MTTKLVKKKRVVENEDIYIVPIGEDEFFPQNHRQEDTEPKVFHDFVEDSFDSLSQNESMESQTFTNDFSQNAFSERSTQNEEIAKSSLEQEYERGLEDGKKASMKQLESEYRSKVSSALTGYSNLFIKIEKEFKDLKDNADNLIIKLSLAIAEKILQKEVTIDQRILYTQVSEAIKKILGIDNITILINPQDENILKSYKPDLLHIFDSLKDISIQSNFNIEKGSCKIETGIGNVDARFSTQLKLIEEALLLELEKQTEVEKNSYNKIIDELKSES